MTARITSISVSGVRTLDDFKLDLDGLTVLIGENGSGKSTIVEACELLRRLTNETFWNEFNQIHGGEAMLLRHGSGEIKIGAEFSGKDWFASYHVSFSRSGISSENLSVFPSGQSGQLNVLERIGEHVKIPITGKGISVPPRLGLPQTQPAIKIAADRYRENYTSEVYHALQSIDVHLPFTSTSYWLSQSQGGRQAPMRDSVTIAPTNQLERCGNNLANAFYALKEQTRSDWEYTMELVRLGLGQWVESVNLRPDAGGGKIAIWIKIANTDKQIPSGSLSDGQLAYLAFVALARLPTPRSLLVFDEIEAHLHPRLLIRVMGLIRSIAERCPVLLTTHSRRVLDDLDEPAKSVGVLELDPDSLVTKLRRLDEAKLKDWLDDYDGLGQVLDAGYPESLFETEAGEGR